MARSSFENSYMSAAPLGGDDGEYLTFQRQAELKTKNTHEFCFVIDKACIFRRAPL